MSKQQNQLYLWLVVFITAIILAVVVIWAVANRQDQEEQQEMHNWQNRSVDSSEEELSSANLSDIVRSARSWRPIFTSWYGRPAPDFVLTDISGKQHKLSDYRGRNVMIILWATWCNPCLIEIPHLIELRKTVSEDKLAMLAVSYITLMPPNTTEMVKKLVERRKINYTVFSIDADVMPAPYSQIRSIPCSFFIDPQGKIKLAAEGLIMLDTARAILQAE